MKEASKAALADGSPKAIMSFIHSGQYVSRALDERMQASTLINDGGPEMKAAGKIAMSGPVDQMHEFIQVGQYMADRKDKLAQTHTAQMQRLLHEADGTAATARKDSFLAAQAAATAKQAKDEANKAAAEAKKSGEQAAAYAQDAKESADQAQQSASQAAQSANAARNVADRADQDAANAEESAAQAEWSANYARDSAAAADDALWSARATGKSASEARSEASKAWSDVLTKRLAEQAAASKQAAEERQKQREQEKKAKARKRCVAYMSRDSVPPCAMAGQPLEAPEVAPDLAKHLLDGGMTVLGITDIMDCIDHPEASGCTLAVVGVLPIGKLKLLKKAEEGVEAIAKSFRAAKAAEYCVKCFLAGTGVLMADQSTKRIETVEVGDSVLATDPVSGVTGARAVTNVIVTEHDKHFNDLTIESRSGTEHLTATNEHPFWSPSAAAWVDAANLRSGDSLRTVDGSTVTVRHNRSFEKTARTYNLTVHDLHTYYVLAGATPVLVHNSGPGCGTNWMSSGKLPHH
ncbi:polymorphic toxin-type HINT domain-containing protein [Streptomyces sp. NPDC052040]|uniref:polymorphic toxin-type HINT domain-containing protein n=1 Tax=Streptomyces sp. NPDC052040 TaxID=3365682 RepID=UPI0037D071A4